MLAIPLNADLLALVRTQSGMRALTEHPYGMWFKSRIHNEPTS